MMKFKYLTLLLFLFSLCVVSGCNHYLLVQEKDGTPIVGAEAEVVSLSINWGKRPTNKNGKVMIQQWHAQTPQYIEVSKKGYFTGYLFYPESWPCEVFLVKMPEGYKGDPRGLLVPVEIKSNENNVYLHLPGMEIPEEDLKNDNMFRLE